MKTTIDSAGRVVIPKELRARLGLLGGQEVEILEREGHLELAPATVPMTLRDSGDGVAAFAERELPPLTDQVVRATLERIRR